MTDPGLSADGLALNELPKPEVMFRSASRPYAYANWTRRQHLDWHRYVTRIKNRRYKVSPSTARFNRRHVND